MMTYADATQRINSEAGEKFHRFATDELAIHCSAGEHDMVQPRIKEGQKCLYKAVKAVIKDCQPQLMSLKKEMKRGLGGEWREFSQFCSFQIKFVDCLLQFHAYLYNRKIDDEKTIKKFKELFLLQNLITKANSILSPLFDRSVCPFMEMMSDMMEDAVSYYRDIIITKGKAAVYYAGEMPQVACLVFRLT